MKKTTKILSSLLACVMLISALPVFVSASDTAPEAFFCDFEEGFSTGVDFYKSQDSEFIAAGFNKGMALNYNSISGNATTGFAAKVVEDAQMGKAYQTPAGVEMYFGVGFDEPVYSGAVKFSYRMTAENEHLPFVMYAQTMGTAYGKTESVKQYMGQIEGTASGCQVMLSGSKTYSQAPNTTKKSMSAGSYYTVEWIVDIDTDTRYLIIDGVEMGSITEPDTNPINSIQGFYFNHSGSSHIKRAMPKFDDITLTVYDMNSDTMNHIQTVRSEGKVKFVFDEIIDASGLSAGDITFTEAGGDSEAEALDVSVVGNTLEVTYDADAVIEDREYVLMADNLKSKNGGKIAGETVAILKRSEDPAVEKVRFVGSNGSKTATDSVSPETTAIELTFSSAVDMSLAEGITLAMEEETEPAEAEPTEVHSVTIADCNLSEDGQTVTLSVPGMFLGDCDYTLEVPDYGFVYKFKTTEGQFAVVDFAATQIDDSPLIFGSTGADGDSIKLSGNIVNTEGSDKLYTVIYAYYKDDMLVGMDSKDYEIKKTTYFDTFTWTADTVPGEIEYDAIRIFVWDSIDGMEALADCQVYSD